MTHWTDRLIALGNTGAKPCAEAVAWARDYPTHEAAWDACPRGDWLLWIAGRLSGLPLSDSRRPLVRASALCAELALPYVRDEWVAGVVLSTVQTCVAWSEWEADDDEMRDAAAYAAADAADADAARSHMLAKCAAIVRAHIACPVLP